MLIDFRLAQKFGFASCERKVGAAEGVNVLVEKNTKSGWEYSVTCIEYTEFNKLGIPDVPVSPGRYMLMNSLIRSLTKACCFDKQSSIFPYSKGNSKCYFAG